MKYLPIKIGIAAALISVGAAACFQTPPLVKAFEKFNGRWIANNENGSYIEVWNTGNEHLLDGYAYVSGGSDSIFQERMFIAATDSGIYYMVQAAGQNNGEIVGFKLTAPEQEDQFVFQNPAHDFPNKIVYQFNGHDKIHVTVSGGQRSFELNFNRGK